MYGLKELELAGLLELEELRTILDDEGASEEETALLEEDTTAPDEFAPTPFADDCATAIEDETPTTDDPPTTELLDSIVVDDVPEFLGAVEFSKQETSASDAARASNEVVILFM